MTVLAPFVLALGAAAAVTVVALHLLTTRRPPSALLPTARFVPMAEARAVARAARPTDLLPLALRAAAVLLAAAAFARPVPTAPGPPVRSVVLLDRSAGVADPVTALAAARSELTEGGALIVYDTAARELASDSIERLEESRADRRPSRGALSAALVVARRAAARIARGADSVRLVIVSPLLVGSIDAATWAFREQWPGGIALVRVAAASDDGLAETPQLMTTLADDPLAPALDALPRARGTHEVRIVRRPATTVDSAWGRETGRVLIEWPLVTSERVAPDGVAAIDAAQVSSTVVAPLARLAVPTAARVIARWRDGAPAAVESALGEGCLRRVGVGLPLAGDLTLRAPFGQLLLEMVVPCGGRTGVALPISTLRQLVGTGGAAASGALVAGASSDRRFAIWLLVAALVALGCESLLRRRRPA